MKHILLSLSLAILAALFGPAAADFNVGGPVLLDASAVYDYAADVQNYACIAGSGSVYLAVWVDSREVNSSDLFAARISSDGTVLDQAGIRLTTNEIVYGRPDVCWNGQSFFVVWSTSTNNSGTDVRGIRVSPAGAVLDSQPVDISTSSDNEKNPDVTWNGTYHIVVWEHAGTSSDAYMARVSQAGVLLDTSPVQVSALSSNEVSPRITSNSGKSLVVWQDDRNIGTTGRDIYGALVSSAGAVLTPDGIAICTDSGSQTSPSSCWAGTHFKAVWTDSAASLYGEIRGTRVDLDGTVLDPAGWSISTGSGYRGISRIAWNGTYSLAVWSDARPDSSWEPSDIYAGRLNDAGSALDGNGFVVCSATSQQTNAAITVMGSVFLTCWMDKRYGTYGQDIRAVRVDSTGTLVGSEFGVAMSAQANGLSSAAYNGQKYLVCWEEYRNWQWDIYGALVDGSGAAPAPGTAFPIINTVDDQLYPCAAWNGENFVITWFEGTSVKAARVSPTGSLLDPSGVTISSGCDGWAMPRLASDGNTCLIVYSTISDMRAALLSRTGTVLSDQQLGASATENALAAVWTGQCYVVAWIRWGELVYRTVDQNGVPQGAGPGVLAVDATSPALACSGQNVLAVWADTLGIPYTLRSQRLNLNGSLLDVSPATIPATLEPDYPTVSWDGIHYLVSWQNYAKRNPPLISWNADFHAARISNDNISIDVAPIAVTNTTSSEDWFTSQCAGPVGRTFIAYLGWEGGSYQCMRAKGLFFDNYLDVALGQLRDTDDGTQVSIPGRVVTAAFPADGQAGAFYVQENRIHGIRVESSQAVSRGDMVTITGMLKTENGERLIRATSVGIQSSGNAIPPALGFNLRSLGGVAPNPRYDTVRYGQGAYNVGLLVDTWAKVTSAGTGYFYVDDGSIFQEQEGGPVQVKVYGSVPDPTPEGHVVCITGISCAEKSNGHITRVLRARDVEIIQ